MANLKITQLPVVTNAEVGEESILPIVDSVDTTTKSISLDQLDERWGSLSQQETNTSNIATQAGEISTLQSEVAANTTAIATNQPMTTGGDMIYGGSGGAPTRLPNGSANQILASQGGTLPPKWGNLSAIFSPPTVSTATAGGTGTGGFATTTAQQGWLFNVSALSSALTVGATYSNNGNTYTVLASLASGAAGQILFCSGTGVTSGTTLTLTSGSGPSSITISQTAPTAPLALYRYTTPTTNAPLYIEVEMVGGGGGGSGCGNNTGTDGNAGLTTVFGTLFVSATGGGGGRYHPNGTPPTAGAVNWNTSPWVGSATLVPKTIQTGTVGEGGNWQSSGAPTGAGSGGNSPFTGAGARPGNDSGAGGSAIANTGSGGAGGYSASLTTGSAGGGSSGGYAKFLIGAPNIQSTYYYAIGAGGAGGSNTQNGGAGGSGVIIITEYYQ